MKVHIIDMHIHTTMSDGTYTPEGIVRLANKAGLRAIAVTDHDTAMGVSLAQKAAENSKLEVIPGIEISVGPSGNTHILGFYINPEDEGLKKLVELVQQYRYERNIEMIKRLTECGFDISYEAVRKFSKSDNIGRLHISQYIEVTGQANDARGFLKKYLATGGLAYVPRKTVSEKEGIEAITNAGGLPFLAHISYFNMSNDKIEAVVKRLVGYGLKGIEGYYSNYTPKHIEFCDYLCKKYGLLKSGGTDFHGARRKGVYLGTGRGNMCVPYELVLEIKKHIK